MEFTGRHPPGAWASRLQVLQCKPDSAVLGASCSSLYRQFDCRSPAPYPDPPLALPTSFVTTDTGPLSLGIAAAFMYPRWGGAGGGQCSENSPARALQEPHLHQPRATVGLAIGPPSHRAVAAGVGDEWCGRHACNCVSTLARVCVSVREPVRGGGGKVLGLVSL